jgi:hypothetical protein
MSRVSKESIIKKRLEKEEKEGRSAEPPPKQPKAPAVPVASSVIRRPRRRLNRRFLITFGIWFAALIAALYFLTMRT